MKIFHLSIQPLSAFGTPLVGDTLFGHLCWAARERFGQSRLDELLRGYTEDKPFAVVSDAMPSGWLPRPAIPAFLIGMESDPSQRKADKRKNWLPAQLAHLPLRDWIGNASEQALSETVVVTQNSINRMTGTTGTGPFAPRQTESLRYPLGSTLDIYCCLDQTRITLEEALELFQDIGLRGYGRDATTGSGKFAVVGHREWIWGITHTQHAMTLAACAPEIEALDASACFYHPQTRFGRHGNMAALTGQPFKKPVLSVRSAAFLSFRTARDVPPFHGCGLGGLRKPVSSLIPETVHQGYAPLVPLNAELRS